MTRHIQLMRTLKRSVLTLCLRSKEQPIEDWAKFLRCSRIATFFAAKSWIKLVITLLSFLLLRFPIRMKLLKLLPWLEVAASLEAAHCTHSEPVIPDVSTF